MIQEWHKRESLVEGKQIRRPQVSKVWRPRDSIGDDKVNTKICFIDPLCIANAVLYSILYFSMSILPLKPIYVFPSMSSIYDHEMLRKVSTSSSRRGKDLLKHNSCSSSHSNKLLSSFLQFCTLILSSLEQFGNHSYCSNIQESSCRER